MFTLNNCQDVSTKLFVLIRLFNIEIFLSETEGWSKYNFKIQINITEVRKNRGSIKSE